jgi:hypothetical protein
VSLLLLPACGDAEPPAQLARRDAAAPLGRQITRGCAASAPRDRLAVLCMLHRAPEPHLPPAPPPPTRLLCLPQHRAAPLSTLTLCRTRHTRHLRAAMASVDVAVPAAPSSPAPWAALSFDDFLTFPAPSPAPTPAALPSAPPAAAAAAAAAPAPAPSPRRSAAVAPSSAATVQVAGTPPGATGPPPPPGSAPEVLFVSGAAAWALLDHRTDSHTLAQRYYLAAELRRIGSSADDHIIEKYVAQHYSSISKKAAAPVASSSSTASAAHAPVAQPTLTYEPYRRAPSPPAPSFAHAQAFRDATPPSPEAFLDPHSLVLPPPALATLPQQSSTVGVHEPFTVTRAPIVPSSNASGSYSNSRRAADAMSEDSSDGGQSEDDDEDDKASFAHLGSNTGGRGTLSAAAMLRPSPEEYRKLSSKEKRQLRNKISARNFRTRRKGESCLEPVRVCPAAVVPSCCPNFELHAAVPDGSLSVTILTLRSLQSISLRSSLSSPTATRSSPACARSCRS